MQSKLAMPGGTHVYRSIAALRARPRSNPPPRAGGDFFTGDSAVDEVVAESSSIANVVSSSLPVANADASSRIERTASWTDEDMATSDRGQENTQAPSSSTTSSWFDPVPLSSTLISGPLVAARHHAMDSAATAQETFPTEVPVADGKRLDVSDASLADSTLASNVQLLSVDDSPIPPAIPAEMTVTAVTVAAAPPPAIPAERTVTDVTIAAAPPPAIPAEMPVTAVTVTAAPHPSPPATPSPANPAPAPQSTPFSPLRVTSVSDTFTTGAEPQPGNSRDGFVTGHPSPPSKATPRPYLASGPGSNSNGYPAFRLDDAAASQYSSAAQSMPARPNYEPRYPLSRSSNCDSPLPPLADALSSSQSIAMPGASTDTYGYQRMPQEGGPVYGYSRSAMPPQQPYSYRLPPPDYGPSGGPLPLAPPGARGLPPPQYGPGPGPQQSDPWDIFEPGSSIGVPQGLLHIDGGVYGGYGGAPSNGYAGGGAGYNSPAPSYGYGGGGGGGYNAQPPPQQYQYGGGGGYGQQQQQQQQQYYAPPPPPGQYGGPPSQPPSGGYRGTPPPADSGQFYGGYPPPAAPRRAAPSTDQNYTYKARAPAGNMPEENLSSYAYGNSYSGGGGFGGGGNFGGQTSYGSPMPGNYAGGQQEDPSSYPGIELLSPGYPEYERHSRQSGGGRGNSQPTPQELRYPGLDGGAANSQQQRAAPSVTEYSDRYSPPAYGSSYSGYTSPSAYGPPPPDGYGQYQQPGGYSRMPPPPPPPPDAQYGYGGHPGAGSPYPGAYSQRPMGMSPQAQQQRQLVPIAGGRPRVLIVDDISPDEMIETMMPFATLPEPSNVAVLAAAGGPELAPSLHLGVLAAALCCIVAAANGVRAPASRTEEEG